MNALATLQAEHAHLDTRERVMEQQLFTTSWYLANTQAPSHITTRIIQHAPEAEALAHKQPLSPTPLPVHIRSTTTENHIPPIIASEGPADGQFTVALGAPDKRTHWH
jgi:hypothetical protein